MKPACTMAANQVCRGQQHCAGKRPAADAKAASLLVIEDEATLAKNIARFLEHSG